MITQWTGEQEDFAMKDKQIDVESQVVKAILESSKIRHAVMEVDHQDGNITLRGVAATEQDKQLAEDIASRQEGVVSVTNEIICD